MTGDIERLALIQYQVAKLRRSAAEALDRETSVRFSSLAGPVGVLSKIDLKGGGILRPLERGPVT